MKLLNEQEAAKLLGVTIAALQKWRQKKRGPTYIKISPRCVRYSPQAIEDFIDSKTVTTSNKAS